VLTSDGPEIVAGVCQVTLGCAGALAMKRHAANAAAISALLDDASGWNPGETRAGNILQCGQETVFIKYEWLKVEMPAFLL
jgi:hypothetical protein